MQTLPSACVSQYTFSRPEGPISARICQGCQINIICIMGLFCVQVDWPKINFGLGGAGGGWLGVISRGAEKWQFTVSPNATDQRLAVFRYP